ncbi:MAG TPA: hypothetical protein VL172_17960, partial [Kofleriaceae bacterium]|nr:hypothetical protein [Kofleriaceae bacterium]
MLVLGICGCGKKHGPGPEEYDRQMYQAMHDALVSPARRGPGFATAPEPPPAAKPDVAGPAYIVLKDVGIAILDVDGSADLRRLQIGSSASVTVAPDGSVVVAGDRVYKLAEDGLEAIGGDSSPSLTGSSPVEVAPDGTIWISAGQTVHGWDGAKWTTYETTEPIDDFAFDGKGRVYTAGARQLGVIDGGSWKKIYDLEGTPHEGVLSNPYF